jgi:hypothetical protein
MVKQVDHFQYISKVRRYLLGAGEQGISQSELNQKVRTRIYGADDLLELLEEWEKRSWVQKFRVKRGSRAVAYIWRATTLLRDDFSVPIEGKLPIAAETDQSVS